MNLKDTFLFNPLVEMDLNVNSRLIITNSKTNEKVIVKKISAGKSLEIPYSKFDSHMDYRYRYQVKSAGRWSTVGKSIRLIPESTTDDGITYAFYEYKGSEKLVVVFQGINERNVYNYIKTLNDVPINRLYIKDNYGEDEKTKTSYYLGKLKSMDIFHATQKLVSDTVEYLGISRKDTIFVGSSKGGYSAMFQGLHFGCGHLFPGGPTVLLGDYLGIKSETSIRPPIFKFLFGELNEENINYGNKLMYQALLKAKNNNCVPNTVIHIGKGEPRYEKHVLPFMKWVKELGIKNIHLEVEDYDTHDQLKTYYPPFLLRQVRSVIESRDK